MTLLHREPMPCSKITLYEATTLESLERRDVCRREVFYVNIIAHAGSVTRGIVIAETRSRVRAAPVPPAINSGIR